MPDQDNVQASQNPAAAVKASDDSNSVSTSSGKVSDVQQTQGKSGTAKSSSTVGAADAAQPPQKSSENNADAQAANGKTGVNPPASTPSA